MYATIATYSLNGHNSVRVIKYVISFVHIFHVITIYYWMNHYSTYHATIVVQNFDLNMKFDISLPLILSTILI